MYSWWCTTFTYIVCITLTPHVWTLRIDLLLMCFGVSLRINPLFYLFIYLYIFYGCKLLLTVFLVIQTTGDYLSFDWQLLLLKQVEDIMQKRSNKQTKPKRSAHGRTRARDLSYQIRRSTYWITRERCHVRKLFACSHELTESKYTSNMGALFQKYLEAIFQTGTK